MSNDTTAAAARHSAAIVALDVTTRILVRIPGVVIRATDAGDIAITAPSDQRDCVVATLDAFDYRTTEHGAELVVTAAQYV